MIHIQDNVETLYPQKTVLRRSLGTPAFRPAAFSLAELIVVMGVMVLMLSLAGQVMSLTVRASGQATAFTETMQAVREMERTLREDLRHVRRDRSVMVIQGNPINTYWTADGRDADDDGKPETGYPYSRHPDREITTKSVPRMLAPPRADLLMFFTERRAGTYLTYGTAGQPPVQVTSPIQQVVYGHALLGDYERDLTGAYSLQFPVSYDPANKPFPPFPAYWPVPAAEWHLARRVLHLMSVTPPPGLQPAWGDYSAERFDNPRFLRAETDVLCLAHPFSYEAVVLNPSPTLTNISGPPRYWPEMGENSNPHARSQLDPTPPTALAGRLAHYLMPHCASFKVEWALDSSSTFVGGKLNYENGMYWFDPGDLGDDLSTSKDDEPLKALIAIHSVLKSDSSQVVREQAIFSLLEAKQGKFDTTQPAGYSLKDRFGGDGSRGDPAWRDPADDTRPNLHVFVANRSNAGPGAERVPDEVFPKALRITVDVYDKLQRLEQPIRHVMILPVGEE